MVHMRGYSFQARHDISGSSFRVNLGKAFAPLLHGEDGIINVVLKVLNSNFEMFYKEDEKALYPPQISRPDYKKGFYYCIRCIKGYKDADRCPNCGIKTRKESRKRGGNGEKPRYDLDGDGLV